MYLIFKPRSRDVQNGAHLYLTCDIVQDHEPVTMPVIWWLRVCDRTCSPVEQEQMGICSNLKYDRQPGYVIAGLMQIYKLSLGLNITQGDIKPSYALNPE